MEKGSPKKKMLNKRGTMNEIGEAGDANPMRKSFKRPGEPPLKEDNVPPKTAIPDPSAPDIMMDWRIKLLKSLGVNVGLNGHTVLAYNPRTVQAGMNYFFVLCLLPRVITAALYYQWIFLCVISEIWAIFISDAGEADETVRIFATTWRSLTTFVLGLFVSLLLAKTYYANRGCFGTVFGGTMGFSQMTVAWVRAPPGAKRPDLADQSALQARQQLVRWANAAFRLMVLECRPLEKEQIGLQLVDRELLTAAEWDNIASLKSRATHVYQWMNNVLHDLLSAGYICDAVFVAKMQSAVDDMRGANVWGLPSLPIMYTLLICNMVKVFLILSACSTGSMTSEHGLLWGEDWAAHFLGFGYLFFLNFLFQGLLDLHGVLFSPNEGIEVSHLPADNFLAFVESVTTALVANNQTLPYKMNIYDAKNEDEKAFE